VGDQRGAGGLPRRAQGGLSRITGLARSTIKRGEGDLDEGPLADGRVRCKGGGGKPLSATDPTLADDLRQLVEPATLGSPVQPLRWVSKSRVKLARALAEMGHRISAYTVGKLLTDALGMNRKSDEGSHRPDRIGTRSSISSEARAAIDPAHMFPHGVAGGCRWPMCEYLRTNSEIGAVGRGMFSIPP
jgi:hypothetical protein